VITDCTVAPIPTPSFPKPAALEDLDDAKSSFEEESRMERVAKRQDNDDLEASFPKAASVHLEMLQMRRRMAHEEVVRKQLAVAWDYVAYLREGGERRVVTTTAKEIMQDLEDIIEETHSVSPRHARRPRLSDGVQSNPNGSMAGRWTGAPRPQHPAMQR